MGVQDNKGLVLAFLGCFDRSASDEALAMMSEDATFWTNGKPHLFAGAGSKSKDEMGPVFRDLLGKLEGGLTMVVVDMVGEGDVVAAELQSRAVTRTGRRTGTTISCASRSGRARSRKFESIPTICTRPKCSVEAGRLGRAGWGASSLNCQGLDEVARRMTPGRSDRPSSRIAGGPSTNRGE